MYQASAENIKSPHLQDTVTQNKEYLIYTILPQVTAAPCRVESQGDLFFLRIHTVDGKFPSVYGVADSDLIF